MTAGLATFMRYLLTGAITAIAYLALSLLFQRWLGLPWLASLLAYTVVVVLHFTLSNFYTFGRREITPTTFSRYSMIVGVFAILNFGVDLLVRALALPPIVLYATNMVVSPLITFVVMKSYVFRDPAA